MQKTKIDWTDYTFNPLTGCLENCWYCYGKSIYRRFKKSYEPTFHPERLDEIRKLKKPAKVFVCSIADLFGKWNNPEHIWEILFSCLENKIHTYQFLTKSPQNIPETSFSGNPFDDFKLVNWPGNFWFGTTITKQDDIWRIEHIKKITCGVKFISFEPLLEDILDLNLEGIDWIIIGKLTGYRRPFKKEWVMNIKEKAYKKGIPVFMKGNMLNVPGLELIQEYPLKRP